MPDPRIRAGANRKSDCCEQNAGAIIGTTIAIIVVVLLCIFCCCYSVAGCPLHDRNNPPPPATNYDPTTGEPAPVVGVAPPQDTIQMMCPAGATTGTLVSAQHNGQTIQVAVPPGVGPGQMFTVAVPAAAPAPIPVQAAPVPSAPIQGTVVG